jgi:hypothetical protein
MVVRIDDRQLRVEDRLVAPVEPGLPNREIMARDGCT